MTVEDVRHVLKGQKSKQSEKFLQNIALQQQQVAAWLGGSIRE